MKERRKGGQVLMQNSHPERKAEEVGIILEGVKGEEGREDIDGLHGVYWACFRFMVPRSCREGL